MKELSKFEKAKQKLANKTASRRTVGPDNSSDDGSDGSENMTLDGPSDSRKPKRQVK